jgi:2-polyprenyl-3-methyl-5-hydroxy-6-metoxy-1,4-benzoquinol methylase
MEILSSCPVCNSEKFKPFLSCRDYTVSHETFQIVACENCGFHFTNPRPAETEIGKYYQSEEYISHSGTRKGFVNKAYHLVRNYTLAKKLQLILRLVGNRKPASIDLLDYGCGTGEFLNTCKKAGLQVSGMEPDDKARNFAIENYGLKILPPNAIGSFKNDSYDIVTLWHVLEHIHRLKEFLGELKRIVKGRGVAVIAVPNLTSLDAKIYKEFWAAYDVPRHLYHFSPKDIRKLFSEFGFELEDVRPMVFDAFYVSMLSEKYKNSKNGNNKNSGKLISALLKGAKSNILASDSQNTYSSQIYILRKCN